MEIERSDLEKVMDALDEARAFFELRDEMNSKIHLGVPRYSPITSKIQAETDRLKMLLVE